MEGALPPAAYGQNGRLTLSRTLTVPTDQSPYTPSSFSGLSSTPPPPIPSQQKYPSGQNPFSGQASPSDPPSLDPSPLHPNPLPSTPPKAQPGGGPTGNATAGSRQPGASGPARAGGWSAQGGNSGSGSGRPAPPFAVPAGFLGRESGAGVKLVLPVAAAPEQAPQELPSLITPGQISFDSSALIPSPALAPGSRAGRWGAPSSQPIERSSVLSQPYASAHSPSKMGGAQKNVSAPTPRPGIAPLSSNGLWSAEGSAVSLQPSSDAQHSKRPAQQSYVGGSLSDPANQLQSALTTQDIEISGTPADRFHLCT